ncbi:MAG: 16S rRNA (guanine(527)-N(7))-methyltransferase RsmG [Anaerolineales bacterium]
MMQNLRDAARETLGIKLSKRQAEAFSWYGEELQVWNERFNLTAIRSKEGIETKHFLDSLSCVLARQFQPSGSMVDVGTGAGFPGLPLKIVFPQIQLTLLESIGKKVSFCRHVVKELNLKEVTVEQSRAESRGRETEYRESYDTALARAVAATPVLVEYVLPLIKVGGCAILQKGETGPVEAQSSENAIHILGGKMDQIVKVELPGVAETRYLLVVRKVAATPDQYPRRPGIPAKRPIE